ncbi:MAG: ATP phosphoribosyltransferase regulatory subunit, partial [Dehalococcoidia bacterium]
MDVSRRCRGMRDLLPPQMRRYRRIEEAFRGVCQGWGYAEVRTPTIEQLHLFTSAGTLSPQALGRVYSFLDWDGWSGERVVLRPDSTIPMARLYVESMGEERWAKLFYTQNVFRFAQGDESREDRQCGVELIGDTQPEGDVELVLMGCEALRRLGLEPTLRLSNPGILRTVLARAGFEAGERLSVYDRILDGDFSALDEIQQRLPEAGVSLRALLASAGEGPPYLNNLRSALLPTVPEMEKPLDDLMAVATVLAETGFSPRLTPALARDFEYYTGPVFQFLVGEQVVGRGGRYDALISLVGGLAMPASGFALDVDLLMELLPDDERESLPSVAIRPAAGGPGDLAATFRLASALRA